MSTKEIVRDVMSRMPDDASLDEVARQIQFVAGVQQAMDEINRGEEIPWDQVKDEIPSWVIK